MNFINRMREEQNTSAPVLMNFDNHMGEWERPASCRDKGRDGVDEGAWGLSWWRVPAFSRAFQKIKKTGGEEGKKKGPPIPPPRPLFLQLGWGFSASPGAGRKKT